MPKHPTKNEQITQLRAQLEEERKASVTLRQTVNAQLVTIDGTVGKLKAAEEKLIQAKSTSIFMKKVPVELRLRIYKLLLTNPKLSKIESIGKTADYGKAVKFELAPAILRTCKVIRDEAEPILYGSNTFILECIGGYGPIGSIHVPQSPLTRYDGPRSDDFNDVDSDTEDETERNLMGHSGTEFHFDFTTFKALKKVKRWRIITGAYRPTPLNPVPSKSFVHFCQALCLEALTRPQRSIEIVLGLGRVDSVNQTEDAQYKFSKEQLNLLLQPLRLLKDIKLELNIAKWKTNLPVSAQLCGGSSEFYFLHNEGEATLQRFIDLAPPFVQKYQALAEDLSPVEKVFMMHKRLEHYADSFERSEKFSKDMCTLQRGHESSRRENRHYGWQLPGHSLGNPFKGYSPSSYHPVELAFSRAIIAKDKEDVTEFKAARALVLKELEPQYRRMIDASKKLRAFVEKEKRSGVFRECFGCGVFHQYEEDPFNSTLGTDLDRYIYELDKIANLLKRAMPDHIQIKIDKGTTMYDSAYVHLSREKLFQKLRWMQKQEVFAKDPSQISKWAKRLVEDLWSECQFTSWARECLFKDDITDIGCKINRKLGQGLMDEELEWIDGFGSDDEDEFYGLHELQED
ncbi:a71dadd4-ea1e-42aa-b844-17f2239db407 [Sclerotinia trifoliorum]|uniref:A71dadd4-ea1e-42aa-b844-17f2239db407 n=1 Tax=Sclerotinia trifoliorum TaxID=28548 RepID=A0A8H2W4H3_9HELO|nr:a71dadd4-ea1e-42aa-b844-17f2239db407 [Sclerotinia trifoliorum]